MLKRLIALTGILAALAGAAAPNALANATCTINNVSVDGFGLPNAQVFTSWDFKCGGALNANFQVTLTLQYTDSSGAWHNAGCASGGDCTSQKPSSGWFTAGTEHSG